MTNLKIFRLLLVCGLGIAVSSCEKETDPDSIATEFTKFPAELQITPPEAQEYEIGVYTLNFKLDAQKQLTDLHVLVEVGESSTAEEGEDFELSTHSFDIPALGGQDGFSLDIHILDDAALSEEDEKIYLKFSSDAPSGLEQTEVLVATIKGCTAPAEDKFVGDYTLSASGGTYGPIFDDQVVTLEALGGHTRGFSAIYYESLGIGNAAGDWVVSLAGCTGTTFFPETDTGLGCLDNIHLIPFATSGTFNMEDDSQFTVVVAESELTPEDPDACGADASAPITLTFTKVN
jgi:hypothetical protein